MPPPSARRRRDFAVDGVPITHLYRAVSGRLDAVVVCRPAKSDRRDRLHPALCLPPRPRLALGDRNVNLIEEHVDVALRIGALPDSGLVARELGHIRRMACASPAYLARFGTPGAPADLAAHRCITFEGVESSTAWTFAGPQGAQRVAIRSRLSVAAADAAIVAALPGLGVTRVLSYQIAEPLRDGKLVRILADYEPDPVPVSLVHPGQGRLPMKARAFLDFADPKLRELLAA